MRVKIWDTFLDYMGVMFIITEVTPTKVMWVDENGNDHSESLDEFESEWDGARYHRVKGIIEHSTIVLEQSKSSYYIYDE